MRTRIAVVDHGAGNLVSIAQGLDRAGAEPVVADRPEGLEGVEGVVLPGVGATGSVMAGIAGGGFLDLLGRPPVPLLGICVGMQVLFERSDEDGATGLGILPGRVRRLPHAPRLPHIGWNDLRIVHPDPLLEGVDDGATVYFVHSYAPDPADPSVVVAVSEYGSAFPAVVRAGSVAGTQFHPERSGEVGLAILANFVRGCARASHAA